jgi:hypothetical protein
MSEGEFSVTELGDFEDLRFGMCVIGLLMFV